MAMLAEKKRRTKWCLNPMGNDWAKDENKFGQKMLEKMGWTPGTGLGARGQGRTEIVKLSVKNDTLGLGNKNEDKKDIWTKQLVDFDSLLAELNGVTKPEEREPIVLPSLEEKSKASRARVHYHKFTRGKDVSKYSSKDLSCILPLNRNQDAEEDLSNAQNNMYEYFNTKHKNPYKSSDDRDSKVNCKDEEEFEEAQRFSENKKIKKKKRKNFELQSNEELHEPVIKCKKTKKSKHLKTENSEFMEISEIIKKNDYSNNGGNTEQQMIELNGDDSLHSVTKKKKKKKCARQEETHGGDS